MPAIINSKSVTISLRYFGFAASGQPRLHLFTVWSTGGCRTIRWPAQSNRRASEVWRPSSHDTAQIHAGLSARSDLHVVSEAISIAKCHRCTIALEPDWRLVMRQPGNRDGSSPLRK